MTIDEAISAMLDLYDFAKKKLPIMVEPINVAISALHAQREAEKDNPLTPCDLCAYNPSSNCDGKPCSLCSVCV